MRAELTEDQRRAEVLQAQELDKIFTADDQRQWWICTICGHPRAEASYVQVPGAPGQFWVQTLRCQNHPCDMVSFVHA